MLLKEYVLEFLLCGRLEDREDIMKSPEYFHERNGNFWVINNDDWYYRKKMI